MLNIFNTDFVPLPTRVAEPVVRANFDADLMAVANGDYSAALSDLTGYAVYLGHQSRHKTESAGAGAPALSALCRSLRRRELAQACGERHRHPGLDASAVTDVLGLLDAAVGVHA